MSAPLTVVAPGMALHSNPGWTGYYMMGDTLGAEVLAYELSPDSGYIPDLEQIEKLAGRRNAKVLVLNSPANPTGSLLSRQTLSDLMEIAGRHDLFVLSDEPYDEIILDGEHLGPAEFDDNGRVPIRSRARPTLRRRTRTGHELWK